MGAFSTVLAAKRTFEVPSRFSIELTRLSNQLLDPAVPTEYGAVDEVQTFAEVADATDGTYTMTVYVRFKDTGVVISFTTGALNHDDNAATIETAIDSASPASVPNGAISVSGGPLDTAPVVLTFDGNAVDETNHPLATITSSLTDGMDPVGDPAYTAARTTAGQTERTSWAILKALGVITDTTPPPQAAATNPTKGDNLLQIKPWFIRELAQEAAAEDSENATYDAILSVIGGTVAPTVVD